MRIYCDHAATTPLCDEAWAAMEPYLRDRFGNASEPHWAGREAREGLAEARERVAAAIGCRPAEVIFCGGGSEADNLALLGLTARGPGRAVASSIEHSAVRAPLLALALRGHEVAWAPVDAHGRVDLDRLAKLVQPGDRLCAVIWANNVTGVVQPVAAIAELCAERGVPLHLDGVQAAAGLDVDLAALPGQVTVALAAHKLHGPKGVGVLAGRGVLRLAPVLLGGGQERGLRPGTENVAGAVGMAVATERAQGRHELRERSRQLRDEYERALQDAIGDVRLVGGGGDRLPGHSLALLAGVRSETLLAMLDAEGIAAAAGSACSSGDGQPSHVLTAMGADGDLARGALRVSLGELNDVAQIAPLAAAVTAAVSTLRQAAASV